MLVLDPAPPCERHDTFLKGVVDALRLEWLQEEFGCASSNVMTASPDEAGAGVSLFELRGFVFNTFVWGSGSGWKLVTLLTSHTQPPDAEAAAILMHLWLRAPSCIGYGSNAASRQSCRCKLSLCSAFPSGLHFVYSAVLDLARLRTVSMLLVELC